MCRTQKKGNYFLIIIQLVLFLNYYFQVGIKDKWEKNLKMVIEKEVFKLSFMSMASCVHSSKSTYFVTVYQLFS